jgi:hypothetical protein
VIRRGTDVPDIVVRSNSGRTLDSDSLEVLGSGRRSCPREVDAWRRLAAVQALAIAILLVVLLSR